MITGGLKLPKSCLGETGNSAFPPHPMMPSVRTMTPGYQAEREARGNLIARSAIAIFGTGRRVYPGKEWCAAGNVHRISPNYRHQPRSLLWLFARNSSFQAGADSNPPH